MVREREAESERLRTELLLGDIVRVFDLIAETAGPDVRNEVFAKASHDSRTSSTLMAREFDPLREACAAVAPHHEEAPGDELRQDPASEMLPSSDEIQLRPEGHPRTAAARCPIGAAA